MSLLQHFPKLPAVLRTFGTSVNTNGIWAPSTTTDTDILILPKQPAVGDELLWLPENDRKRSHFYTWTDTPIEIHDCTERKDADWIIYSGRAYMIVKAEDWEAGGFREILMRLLSGVTP